MRPGGRVRWRGRWYRLVDGPMPARDYEQYGSVSDRAMLRVKPAYDGRMDGMRGMFYTYGTHHEASKNHVYLHSIPSEPWPGTTCVGGVFVWNTFRAEELGLADRS